jgi:hypothetical protein
MISGPLALGERFQANYAGHSAVASDLDLPRMPQCQGIIILVAKVTGTWIRTSPSRGDAYQGRSPALA